jgi:hypothetical protein
MFQSPSPASKVQKNSSLNTKDRLPKRASRMSSSGPRYPGPKNLPYFTLLGGLLYTLYTSGRFDLLLDREHPEGRRPLFINDFQTHKLKLPRQNRSISTRKKV